jgi:hypothetical protein
VLTYEVEQKPLKAKTDAPKDVDFMSELMRGRFSLTCNINHGGRVCTAKIFDKSDPEGDEASKREFKNLKSLRHERIVSARNDDTTIFTPRVYRARGISQL